MRSRARVLRVLGVLRDTACTLSTLSTLLAGPLATVSAQSTTSTIVGIVVAQESGERLAHSVIAVITGINILAPWCLAIIFITTSSDGFTC